jgi:hypothetical protein
MLVVPEHHDRMHTVSSKKNTGRSSSHWLTLLHDYYYSTAATLNHHI